MLPQLPPRLPPLIDLTWPSLSAHAADDYLCTSGDHAYEWLTVTTQR